MAYELEISEFLYNPVSIQYKTTTSLDATPHEKFHTSITIRKPPYQVFNFFRNPHNLPLFIKDLLHVEVISPELSRWYLQTENKQKIHLDIFITAETAGHMICWKTIDSDIFKQSGKILFTSAPATRGTIINLTLDYNTNGSILTDLLTKFRGSDPETLILTNLRRFKAYLETGEIATTEGQPSGREDIL